MDTPPEESNDDVSHDLLQWSTPVLRRAALEDTSYGSGALGSDFCNISASVSGGPI